MAPGVWSFEAVCGAIQMAHVDEASPEFIEGRLARAEVKRDEAALQSVRVW